MLQNATPKQIQNTAVATTTKRSAIHTDKVIRLKIPRKPKASPETKLLPGLILIHPLVLKHARSTGHPIIAARSHVLVPSAAIQALGVERPAPSAGEPEKLPRRQVAEGTAAAPRAFKHRRQRYAAPLHTNPPQG